MDITLKEKIMIRNNKRIDSELCHDLIVKNFKPKLSYESMNNFNEWKQDVKRKFVEVG